MMTGTPSVSRMHKLGIRNIMRQQRNHGKEWSWSSWETRSNAEVWLVTERSIWIVGRSPIVIAETTLYLVSVLHLSGFFIVD